MDNYEREHKERFDLLERIQSEHPEVRMMEVVTSQIHESGFITYTDGVTGRWWGDTDGWVEFTRPDGTTWDESCTEWDIKEGMTPHATYTIEMDGTRDATLEEEWKMEDDAEEERITEEEYAEILIALNTPLNKRKEG